MDFTDERHKMFADEYLRNGLNGTQAYKSIYKGVTEASARSTAPTLLANPSIKTYITEQIKSLSLEKKITREYLVDDLLKLIESCQTQGVDGSGTIVDRANWNKAIQTLSKILGFNSENVNHTGNIKHEYNLNFPGIEIKANVKSIKPSEHTDYTDYSEDTPQQP